MKVVLVTGGAGYVGSGLLRVLLKEGYQVICVDNLNFGGESLIDIYQEPNFFFHKCDINNYFELNRILEKYRIDAVIHLAAIVGDPACKIEPKLAEKTNWLASKNLLNRCIEIGIQRFVFASTCSNYGKMSNSKEYVTEESPLKPISLYAELKVRFEKYMLTEISKRKEFCPTALRFSTVYGLSPRMRFDLTVNEFAKDLALGKELTVFGEQFWRPYCHVKDFSKAFLAVLKARNEKVSYKVFNVGDTNENYTKQMIVNELLKNIPDSKIKFVKKDEDPRDYRVSFEKIKSELGFKISKKVPEGIQEIIKIVKLGIIKNPEDQKYYNIPH